MAGARSEYGFKDPAKLVHGNWRYAPTAHHRFDTADDVIALAARSNSTWTPRASRSHDPDLGTRSWEEGLALARYGWPEGRHRLIRDLRIQALTVSAPAPRWTFDYAGAFPDVPRFLGGELDCMIDFRPDLHAVRPIVRLAVSPITYSDVSFDAVACWGAALVSWIDELEQEGQRVEVTWLSCSLPDTASQQHIAVMTAYSRFAISFCLKAADQPVELDRLAFWIMHPASQRRIQFAVKEQFDIQDWFMNYGYPEQNTVELATLCSPGTLVLSVKKGAPSVSDGLKQLREEAEIYFAKQSAAA